MNDKKEKINALKEFKKTVNEYKQSHETIQSNLNEIETIQRQVSCRFEDYLDENYLKKDTYATNFDIRITSVGLVVEYIIPSVEFDFNKIKDLFDIMGLPRIDNRREDKKLTWIVKGNNK